MNFYFQKKILFGFLAAMSIILWLAVSSFLNSREYKNTTQWVSHTNEVLYHAEQLLTLTINLESAQRGYSITGNPIFLEPYNSATELINDHLKHLKHLTSDNYSQQQRIEILAQLLEKKVAFAERIVLARKISFDDAQKLNASLVGKNLMDEVKKQITNVQQEEKELLKQRKLLSEYDVQRFNFTFTSLLVTTIIILALVFYSIHFNLRKRYAAEASLKLASEQLKDLYDNSPCGYHSLNHLGVFENINKTWLAWLRYENEAEVIGKLKFTDVITPEDAQKFQTLFPKFKKEGQISDVEFEMVRKDGTTFPVLLSATALYDAQGNFIKSRSTVFNYTERKLATEKINQLNQELEAFTYSVSHDLRAPLRSIDGYTRILLEDYESKLDEEGRRVLNIVVKNARKMGNLIDDLLDFSRVSRKEISTSPINMDMLVRSVMDEIAESEKGRIIEKQINVLMPCVADPNLMRQVWINLISNAVKYTRKKDKACITISSMQRGDERIYTITDNGTGFDMQYAHKLFGVFQRLHRQQDFEGTGVGLAIVHRIVTRHGGKIWAEGKVDEGAKFYFSIPHAITT